MGQPRIVIVEEGPLIGRLVTLFERSEEETTAVRSSGECVCEVRILAPNLILLELAGAGADQTDVWRQLRDDKTSREIPVFKLAIAKEQSDNRGGDVAASEVKQEHSVSIVTNDDPLSSHERMTDSSSATEQEPVLQIGSVRIDRHGHWAYANDHKLHLTPTEFRLLECFLQEPGRAFTRSQLLDVAIGNAGFVMERTIDVHIRSLRMKLGAARELIETIRGVGYRFRETQDLE
jgi:two-component system, OmpR family, phosphate regulon response regulator PhoB